MSSSDGMLKEPSFSQLGSGATLSANLNGDLAKDKVSQWNLNSRLAYTEQAMQIDHQISSQNGYTFTNVQLKSGSADGKNQQNLSQLDSLKSNSDSVRAGRHRMETDFTMTLPSFQDEPAPWVSENAPKATDKDADYNKKLIPLDEETDSRAPGRHLAALPQAPNNLATERATQRASSPLVASSDSIPKSLHAKHPDAGKGTRSNGQSQVNSDRDLSASPSKPSPRPRMATSGSNSKLTEPLAPPAPPKSAVMPTSASRHSHRSPNRHHQHPPIVSTLFPQKQDVLMPCAEVPPAPPTSMYWSKTPVGGRLPRGMRAHSATLVGSHIWCFGGCDLKGSCSKDVWRLDCDSFTWTKIRAIGDIPPPTRAHTSIHSKGRLFIFGGGDGPTYYDHTYYFDTLSYTWTQPKIAGDPPSKRRAHTAVLYKEKIIVFGGGNGSHALNDLHSLDVSDIRRLRWRKLTTYGKEPIARGYHSMSLVGDKCLVYGGSDGTECFSDVHILDMQTMTWSQVKTNAESPVSFPRLAHAALTIGSYIVIIDGHDGISFSNDILFFNLISFQWEIRKAHGLAPSPRGYHATVMHDSRIFLLGGFNGRNVFEEMYTLDLAGSGFLPQITNFEVLSVDDEPL